MLKFSIKIFFFIIIKKKKEFLIPLSLFYFIFYRLQSVSYKVLKYQKFKTEKNLDTPHHPVVVERIKQSMGYEFLFS